jgi:glc operon protein GlcG
MHTQIVLSLAGALAVLNAIRAELETRGLGAAVAVTDAHGELIAFVRTDGCPLASVANAQNKAFTAARERRDSRAVGDSARQEGWPLSNFGDPRYIGWGGGIPLVVNGQVVGAVGVSGLPEATDIELARLGAAALGA